MYSLPQLDSLSAYGKFRFYARLFFAQDKDAVLRAYRVPVLVPYKFSPTTSYYGDRLRGQVHEFRNQLVIPLVSMRGNAYTSEVVLDLYRIRLDNPLPRIMLAHHERINLPTALYLLAAALVQYPATTRTAKPFAWLYLIKEMETQGGRGEYGLRRLIEDHYLNLFKEHLIHQILATENGNCFYVKEVTEETKEVIARHLPFVPYAVEHVPASMFRSGGRIVQLSEVGMPLMAVDAWEEARIAEYLSGEITTYYRLRKLRALLD